MTQIQNKTHYHYLHFLQEEIKVLSTSLFHYVFLTQCSQKQHCVMNEQHVNANNILQLVLLKIHFTFSNLTCIY